MNAIVDQFFDVEPESEHAIAARKIVEVEKEKPARKEKKEAASPDAMFDDVEPWSHQVQPAELLTDVSNTLRRFISCTPETANTAALWVAMTWFMDEVQVAPLAVITAPEKRCGKTQLLTAMSRMSCRPLPVSNISAPALFRSIDAWSPSIFIDEADAFMKDNEDLRGLINCGHTRDLAYIVRTVGAEFTPKKFNVWSAKAISGIGHLADTLMDRAIVLELRRKLPTESVERLRYAGEGLWVELSRKLARFAQDFADDVGKSRPDLPDELNDRAQDNWEPLLQIADVAGGNWPKLARIAAHALSSDGEQSKTIGVELLADIQEAFEAKQVDRLSSADLIAILTSDEEKPWAGYNRGFPMKPAQVAKRLKEYGICSNTIRVYGRTPKGYLLKQFEDAFNRYLFNDAVKPALSATPPQANEHAGLGVADMLRVADTSATRNTSATRKPNEYGACGGVAANGVNTTTAEVEGEI